MSNNHQEIVKVLEAKSDFAYSEYIRLLMTNECLGWEAKVKSGKFGETELRAHQKASEQLAKHRTYIEIITLLNQN